MKNFIFLILIGLFLSACSKYNAKITKEYDNQHYTQAYKTLQHATMKESNDWLLWKMQSAFITFSYFGPHFSLIDLEEAEQKFKINESEGLLSSVGENIGATLSNDLAIPYKGLVFEGVFLNFYKALAFSSMGDSVQARIEFNRANDRQRRAKDYYAKEIKKSHDKAIKAASEKKKNTNYEKSTTDYEINKIINEKYTTLREFAIYKDLINPIVPYVSGLYFMIEGDFIKSIDLLKESYGISGANIIAKDMQLLEYRKNKANKQTYTWIIIEDGDMARKDGIEISMPFALENGVNAINMALPHLKEGKNTYISYRVNDAQADMVSSVSNLFASEFEKQLMPIITRAIISTLLKYSITYSANEFGGDYGVLMGLVTTIAFSAINQTDTRTSLMLPSSIWATRVKNTDSNIKVFGNNIELLNLPITNDCNILDKKLSSAKEFEKVVKAKSKDLSARIHIFQNYYESGNEDKVCAKTDNIVYVRVHHGTITHAIIKGD